MGEEKSRHFKWVPCPTRHFLIPSKALEVEVKEFFDNGSNSSSFLCGHQTWECTERFEKSYTFFSL